MCHLAPIVCQDDICHVVLPLGQTSPYVGREIVFQTVINDDNFTAKSTSYILLVQQFLSELIIGYGNEQSAS